MNTKPTEKERLEYQLENAEQNITFYTKEIDQTQQQIDDLTKIKKDLIQNLFFYTELQWKTRQKLIEIGANKKCP